MMPVIGWTAGLTVRDHIERYDHWIAFGLLAYVGGNMIREAFKLEEDAREQRDPTRGLTLVMLSVATSIDALAVGLTIAMLKVPIWNPALIIGVVAGVFTIVGLYLGKSVGAAERLSPVAEVLGGIVLLAIGVKILIEHDAFAALFG
jgi:putative Mn2+ efflux pump MntP